MITAQGLRSLKFDSSVISHIMHNVLLAHLQYQKSICFWVDENISGDVVKVLENNGYTVKIIDKEKSDKQLEIEW